MARMLQCCNIEPGDEEDRVLRKAWWWQVLPNFRGAQQVLYITGRRRRPSSASVTAVVCGANGISARSVPFTIQQQRRPSSAKRTAVVACGVNGQTAHVLPHVTLTRRRPNSASAMAVASGANGPGARRVPHTTGKRESGGSAQRHLRRSRDGRSCGRERASLCAEHASYGRSRMPGLRQASGAPGRR